MSNPNSQYDRLAIRQAYMNPEALHIRKQTHTLYADPQINFPHWVLTRQNHWKGDELILDINPSDGDYLETIREFFPNGTYIASDISTQMLDAVSAQHQNQPLALSVNAHQQLPFPADSFDIVLASDLLYHTPDLHETIAELHRILKPGGLLLASTHSQYTMGEFDTLTRRALTLLGHPPRESLSYYGSYIENFSLENSTMTLARYFRAVARHEIPSTFIFREAKPVIDYLNSSRAIREISLPQGVNWDDFLLVMSDQIRRLIAHFGELAINCLSGVLLATDSGGFSHQYFELLDA